MRKGQEMTKTVTLGRLEDGEKAMAQADDETTAPPTARRVANALGMELSAIDDEARKTLQDQGRREGRRRFRRRCRIPQRPKRACASAT